MKIINYKILLFLLFIICSCTNKNKDIDTKILDIDGPDKSKYKIVNIKMVNDVYVIYASHNNNLYKILSHYENPETKCNQIKVGKYYNLELKSILNPEFKKNGRSSHYVGEVSYFGTIIKLEKDSINDLHYSEKIRNLCLLN